MASVKAITLSDEAYEIWKDMFGSYSQKFSKWISDKLVEESLNLMNVQQKKQYLKEKELELKQEKENLESEKNNLKLQEQQEKESEILKKQEQEKRLVNENYQKELEVEGKISTLSKLILHLDLSEELKILSDYKTCSNFLNRLAKLNSELPTSSRQSLIQITPKFLLDNIKDLENNLKTLVSVEVIN